MATQQWYFLNTKVSGINHLDVQSSSFAGTDFTTTGWQPGAGAAAGEYSELYAGVVRADTTFTAPAVPTTIDTTNGNGYRLTGLVSGTYAAGAWSFSFRLKVDAGASTDAGVSFLLWKSSNADGSGGSAVGSRQETTFATNITTGSTVTASYDPGALTLTNEYLFLLVAIRLDPVGTSSPGNNLFFRGGTSTHSVTTTDWAAAAASPGPSIACDDAFGPGMLIYRRTC